MLGLRLYQRAIGAIGDDHWQAPPDVEQCPLNLMHTHLPDAAVVHPMTSTHHLAETARGSPHDHT